MIHSGMKKLTLISSLLLLTALSSSAASASNSIHANGLKSKVLNLGIQAYQCADRHGQIKNPILSIVDYSLPSTKPRLWIIDMKKHKVLYRLLVAHGKNSGELYAKYFSNDPGSLASSLGAFIANETYYGQHGYSLYLDGLERGINDNARSRHIIVHGAPYVNEGFALQHNYVGRSWGCLALSPKKVSQVINTIQGGSLIFAYAPQIEHDPYLNQCKLSK